MGTSSAKSDTTTMAKPMQDPFDIYIPLESLTEPTVRSIISVATRRPNWDFSERTLLISLLAINRKLAEIENNKDGNEHIPEHVKNIRQWLVNDQNKQPDWNELEELYKMIAQQKSNELARYYGSNDTNPYFELRISIVSYT